MINEITIPIFEFNKDGSIKPNPIFHRSWDKLHSRCIEYPFAASQLGSCNKILDVGTSKSDLIWIKWLDSLSNEVYATDYDRMDVACNKIKFYQSDVRNLPFEENFFDKIFAVSVVEHIGLEDSQTIEGIPNFSNNGDVEAILELRRVLKPGGELVMTLPFSFKSFMFLNSARIYSKKDLKEIDKIIPNKQIDYYEYQYSGYENLFEEFGQKEEVDKTNIFSLFSKRHVRKTEEEIFKKASFLPAHYGVVTWRRIPLENAKAKQNSHCDGVICGVWTKSN